MEKLNHTTDLDYEQLYNNDTKFNFTYNNKVNKVVEEPKCVSTPKNKDILIYSLGNKYPHNNHRNKNILDINQTEKKIYDTNSQNDKYFKENNNINLTVNNQNNKKKSRFIQYFNKKLINSTFNKKTRNGEYIPDRLDIFNLSKEKKDKTLIQNNNINKATKILQNKYDDSQWIDKNIKHKRKLNILKIKKQEPLNIIENINIEKSKENFNNNDNSFIKKETQKIYKDKYSISENNKINAKESTLNSQEVKISPEDKKKNTDYSKYKQNINSRLDIDKKIPKNINKTNEIDIKNINNNMKFYKNINYIIYNNNINENSKSRNIKSVISNKSIQTNDKNNKIFENFKIKNRFQAYDLNNSRNTNDIYFEQNRSKEESLNFNNFKKVNTNQNYIKKIDIKNNRALNITRNNNIMKRTFDIIDNDSLERLNLTSRNQRVIKGIYDNANNYSYFSKEKSHFLFDKINNINELQKSNYETHNYNSIINLRNDVYTLPSTNYIDNIYPLDNYTLLNNLETEKIYISTNGKQ